MGLSLRRWRPRHLLLSWIGYWVVALLVALRNAIGPIWRVTTNPAAKGSISAGFGDEGFTMSVMEAGRVVWQGSASLTSILLWAAGPPLLLFLLWLAARPRAAEPALTSAPRR